MKQFGLVTTDEIETENQIANEGAGSLSDQMKTAKTQYELAFGYHKKTAEHVWLMGQALTKAKELHKQLKKQNKTQPNWDTVLEEHGITVPSDNRARRLYKGCSNIEQLQGRTIMQAYKAVGISNSTKTKPTTKSEAAASETSNDQLSSTLIDSSSENAEEMAEDVWRDATESDLMDPNDNDSDDDVESDDENDTDHHGTDLSDEEEDSKDVLDELDSLIAKAESIQTSEISDDDISEAFKRIDHVTQRLDEMTDELIARLKAKVMSERHSCGVVPSTV